MRTMHSATSLLLATAFALISSTAYAKPPQPYHVEVIIFERSAAGSQLEYWPDDIKLSYPADVVFIKSPELLIDDNSADIDINEVRVDTNIETPPNEAANLAQPASPSDFLDPRILPARSENILSSEASKLSERYRILFHQAWQQTFTATDKAPAVVINGGDTFDERSELGGSIRLSINKFIHIDTDLWLTKFSPNLGQAQQWPMPPLAPKPQVKQKLTQEETSWQIDQYETPNIGINAETLSHASGDKYQFDASSVLGDSYTLGGNERFSFLPDTIYALKQSRRMRSKEMHYIDHPRFGIIIRIDPISFEEVIPNL